MRKSIVLVITFFVLIFLLSVNTSKQSVLAIEGEQAEPTPTISFGLGALTSPIGKVPTVQVPEQSAEVLSALPSSIDLSDGLPPIGHQGETGTCTAWAVSYYYKTYQQKQEHSYNLVDSSGNPIWENIFSPNYVYNQIPHGNNMSSCEEGTRVVDALGLIAGQGSFPSNGYGDLPLAEFPWNPNDCSRWPTDPEKDKASKYTAEGYGPLFQNNWPWNDKNQPGKPPFSNNLNQIKNKIANEEPVVLVVPVYKEFVEKFDVASCDDPIAPPQDTNTYHGLHAVLAVGYDDNNGGGGVKIVNSWGKGWGCEGFGYISYDFVRQFVIEAWTMTDRSDGPLPTPPSSEDASFVSDITISDGTIISQGKTRTKTWRLKNVGSTTWDTSYQLAFVSGDQMGAPDAVNIPKTVAPGETVDISVNITAPSEPGQAKGVWQMRNPQGTYFGDQVWVDIQVQSQSTYAITLEADPPSPADADSVNIHAKADNFPNFRAMRLKIDGDVVHELGAPEFNYTWDTTGYKAGYHSIVLEVADQTDTSWSHPETKSLSYELEGTTQDNNLAPYRPALESPYDWYVYYSGNTAQLCAQAKGDPDGDAVTEYYFDIYDSAEIWNSGWVSSSCVTTSALGPYDYQWRAKVRDSGGAESDWSDTRHFTLVNPDLEITELYFEPQDPESEKVKIRACTEGQGGVGITMRVSVNDANDGSDSGEWHIIKELGVPCFNETDAPIWNTLDYGDGTHLVRVEAHGTDTSWDGAAVREETYTLPHRRPGGTRIVAPVPLSQDIHDPIYLNSRTINFQWDPTIRAQNYTLHISTDPSPKDDPDPVYRENLGSGTTTQTVTLSQDYPILYWQVSTNNDVGSNASGDQLFGIDRQLPNCQVQDLPDMTYETVYQVGWTGSDSLSGLDKFDIQYKDSTRGVWTDWLSDIPANKTTELFHGKTGHTYSFRCRARDKAHNQSGYPSDADTSTTVDPSARPESPWWNTAYSQKRNLTILNNMGGTAIPANYPVRIHFDSTTTPTAAELYNASQSATKCNDLRVVYEDTTELDRVVENCSSDAIDVWFRNQIKIGGGASDSSSHQLYYGNPNAGTPPSSLGSVFDPPKDGNTVGLWYMYEGSGSTLYDYSGNNHHCSIDSTTNWVSYDKFSGALDFKGGTDGPTVNCGSPADFNLQSFTFEFFFKRNSGDPAGGRLAGQVGDTALRWVLKWHNNEQIALNIWPCPSCGAEQFITNTSFKDTAWHHLSFSLENSQVKIYVDGNLDQSGQVEWGNINDAQVPLTIGSAEDIARTFADMTHVRYSNTVRTDFSYAADITSVTTEPTLAAGNAIDPPETGSPDLVIQDLNTYPNPDGGVLIEAIVQNQGDLSTKNGFYTDLYLDHLPSGAGDYTGSIQFWVNEAIAAGETVTLTTEINDLATIGGKNITSLSAMEEAKGTLHAQADSSGVVSEPDDLNNISSGTDICLAAADMYEKDGETSSASSIALGDSQQHNFDKPGDQDWMKFNATQGKTYTLSTSNLGSSADTYLYLYDQDGMTLIASNDDYNNTLVSQIEWTAPAEGTYYALVKHWNPNVGGCGTSYTISLYGDQTFADVPFDHWAYDFVEAIYDAGLTSGCSKDPLMYCPDATVTRAEMAVFLENGIHYPDDYSPPDVEPSFGDTAGHWAEDWIEALYSDGITAGCSTDPLRYCPDSGTTRAQMAVFLLKSKHGSSYTPPDVEPTFNDTTGHWAEDWIEQLAAEGITAGCGDGNYCPEQPVTRAQIAVFLTRTFNLPMP